MVSVSRVTSKGEGSLGSFSSCFWISDSTFLGFSRLILASRSVFRFSLLPKRVWARSEISEEIRRMVSYLRKNCCFLVLLAPFYFLMGLRAARPPIPAAAAISP